MGGIINPDHAILRRMKNHKRAVKVCNFRGNILIANIFEKLFFDNKRTAAKQNLRLPFFLNLFKLIRKLMNNMGCITR